MTIWRLFTQSVCTGFFFIHPDDGIYKLRKWARGRKMFTLSSVQCPSSFLPLSYNISHGGWGDYSVLHARFRLMVEQP